MHARKLWSGGNEDQEVLVMPATLKNFYRFFFNEGKSKNDFYFSPFNNQSCIFELHFVYFFTHSLFLMLERW